MTRFVRVLADCPGIEGLLTYSVPEELELKAGDLLNVPLSNRMVGAIAVDFSESRAVIDPDINSGVEPGLDSEPDSELDSEKTYKIKPIDSLISNSIFPQHFWELLQRTADYYHTPLVQTLKAALPPKLLSHSNYRVRIVTNSLPLELKLSEAARAVWDFLQTYRKQGISRKYLYQKLPKQGKRGLRELQTLTIISVELEQANRPKPKYEEVIVLLNGKNEKAEISDRQQELINLLQRLGGESSKTEFLKLAKSTSSTLKSLVENDYIAIQSREIMRRGGKSEKVISDRPKVLTGAQSQALAAIQSLQAPNLQLLLHGVTGSGKTEVYLQAIAPILKQGKSVLVLVPEIGLTPQLTNRFCARFGDLAINVYHSRLSDGERFDTWRSMLSGEPQVVIGTRSAIFAPLPNLAMIILDEEHDSSFKQDQPQPCYHARTVAQWRSQLEKCALIFGSATPSAETLHQANIGESIYISMADRIGFKPMPKVSIVDMRIELADGNRSIFSKTLQAAIAKMQTEQKQGILFIHRRGHSTFISCRSCGYVVNCPHCDISLTFHLDGSNHGGRLVCHYCGFSQLSPNSCPSCDSTYFKHFGSGTQKIEQEIASLFPDLRILRFDSDTTRNKNQHLQILETFQQGGADLLIGTQMLTKGLDIPQVTLVGVVSADGLLNFSDYRAGERAFQILTQVGGRAGRGEDLGEVIIQTYSPEHPVIEAVQNYQFAQFMQSELSDRQLLNYPPIGQLALIRLSCLNAIAIEKAANQLAKNLRLLESCWQVLGATPALITKVADRYRWQILLKFAPENLDKLPSMEELKILMGDKSVRLSIDIDPLNIL
jgi:primosomal protein N' (replication factor Y) (superfamily II helicase)